MPHSLNLAQFEVLWNKFRDRAFKTDEDKLWLDPIKEVAEAFYIAGSRTTEKHTTDADLSAVS